MGATVHEPTAVTQPARWLGTTVDMHAVRRDAVLAGVFTGLNALAGTLDWLWLLPGILFGAGIGAVLHVMPAEPAPGDSPRGRIIIRTITGCIGGAWAGMGFAYVASGYAEDRAPMPTISDLVPHILVGAGTGALWYLVWGIWETRNIRR